MDWRRIPHAEGYEMSESGDVRRADGLLVPYYRLLWGGRHAVMSAETLYRMTFDGPLPERSSGAPHSVDVDERRLEAAQRLAERLRHENDELRARFAVHSASGKVPGASVSSWPRPRRTAARRVATGCAWLAYGMTSTANLPSLPPRRSSTWPS